MSDDTPGPQETSLAQLAQADWPGLEQDVVLRIRLLRLAAGNLPRGQVGDKIANDLILPNLRLLGAFVANVDIAMDRQAESK